MRWDRFFDDLEDQLASEWEAERAVLDTEAERLRLSRVTLRERLRGLPASAVSSFEFVDATVLTGEWRIAVGSSAVKATDWTTIEFFYSTLSNGQPSWWAYRDGYLRIYPLPSQNYNLRIFGQFRLPPLVNDADSNDWTDEGFNLIRYTVLKRLYSYPIRDAQQVQNAMQAGEAALEYLRKENERRSRQGRMRAFYG